MDHQCIQNVNSYFKQNYFEHVMQSNTIYFYKVVFICPKQNVNLARLHHVWAVLMEKRFRIIVYLQ